MASAWDLVGGNPAPGDPEWIRTQAATLGRIAEDAGDCQQQLNGIYGRWGPSDWTGIAADAFRDHLGNIIPDLSKATASYGAASSALGTFADTLSELQTTAQRALARARTAQNEQAVAASAVRDTTAQLSATEQRAGNLSQEISTLTTAIRARQEQLGVHAPTDPLLVQWMQRLTEARIDLADTEELARAIRQALATAEDQLSRATESLAAARRSIMLVGERYDLAVRLVRSSLQDASAQGIRNVSFIDRAFQSARLDVEHLTREAGRDSNRFAGDLLLLAQGRVIGLKDLADWAGHDVVAAAPEIHAVTHALNCIVQDVASVVDEAAPFIEVGCVVLAVALAVVQPEFAPLAVAAIPLVDKATLGVDAVAVGTGELEVASDGLMELDGKGSEVNLSQDTENLIGDSTTLAVDAVNGDVDGALDLPSMNDAADSALSGSSGTAVVQAASAFDVDQAWSKVAESVDGIVDSHV